jgi:hypothetical protein
LSQDTQDVTEESIEFLSIVDAAVEDDRFGELDEEAIKEIMIESAEEKSENLSSVQNIEEPDQTRLIQVDKDSRLELNPEDWDKVYGHLQWERLLERTLPYRAMEMFEKVRIARVGEA